MPTFARHRRPGRGMLFLILIAAAVFWTGISIGIVMGRRHRLANPVTAPAAPATGAVQLRPGDRIQLRLAGGGGGPTLAETPLTVDAQGYVNLPPLGTIRAQYLTPAQLEQTIVQGFKERNLVPPGTVQIIPLPTTAPAGQ